MRLLHAEPVGRESQQARRSLGSFGPDGRFNDVLGMIN